MELGASVVETLRLGFAAAALRPGARALGRFDVRIAKALELPDASVEQTMKRRERRAPLRRERGLQPASAGPTRDAGITLEPLGQEPLKRRERRAPARALENFLNFLRSGVSTQCSQTHDSHLR